MIVSEQEYKERQGLKNDLTSETSAVIRGANAFVLRLLNVTDQKSSFTKIFKGRDTYYVDNINATKVTSLTLVGGSPEGKANWASSCTIVGPGVIYMDPIPSPGMYVIEFDSTEYEWPEDLKAAVVMLIEYWEKKEYKNSQSFGGEGVGFTIQETGIPKHIRSILYAHRII